MPIYAYRCTQCEHAEDVLQKMSAAPLTICPACGQSTYAKQVTAAGFQLKGSGWYVTDFRNNASKANKTDKPNTSTDSAAGGASTADSSATKPSSNQPSDAKPSDSKPNAPAATASSTD